MNGNPAEDTYIKVVCCVNGHLVSGEVTLLRLTSLLQVTPSLAETLLRYRTDIETIFNIIDKDHSGKLTRHHIGKSIFESSG